MKFFGEVMRRAEEKRDSLDAKTICGIETHKYHVIPLGTDIVTKEQHRAALTAWENGLYVEIRNGLLVLCWDERVITQRTYPGFSLFDDVIVTDPMELPPACPLCGGYMVKQIDRYGKYAGQVVWHCAKERGCIGRREIASAAP